MSLCKYRTSLLLNATSFLAVVYNFYDVFNLLVIKSMLNSCHTFLSRKTNVDIQSPCSPCDLIYMSAFKFLSIPRISVKFCTKVLPSRSHKYRMFQFLSISNNNNVDSRIHEARATVVSLTSHFWNCMNSSNKRIQLL